MEEMIANNNKAMVELKRMYLLKHLDVDDAAVDTLGIYNEHIAGSDDMKVYEAQAFFENMGAQAGGCEDVYKWVCVAAQSRWNPKEHRFFTYKSYMNDGVGMMFPQEFGEKETRKAVDFIIGAEDGAIERIFTEHALSDSLFRTEMLGADDVRMCA